MGQPVIQTSFNSGEWAPALNARVDLAKYHGGAALLRNFFVDYRGGATARAGTRYILQALGSALQVRLIPFQASFTVSYVLEFGQSPVTNAGYLRFYSNGAPILESATTITAVAAGSPTVFTDAANGYANGDWLFIANTYYIVANHATNTFTLTDLFGNAITGTPFAAPQSAQRIYTIASPYAANELSLIKFTLNVSQMILCHPNHPPYLLTLVTAANWTLAAINFAPTIAPPSSPGVTSTFAPASGSVGYSYITTAVDVNGQESAPSTPGTISNIEDIRSVAGTIIVTVETPPANAVSFNIYRALPSYTGSIPIGAQYGFMGNITGTAFVDSNGTVDFSQTPPIEQDPFSGAGIQTITMTSRGSYAGLPVPSVSFSGGSPVVPATAIALLGVASFNLVDAGTGYLPGDVVNIGSGVGTSAVVTSVAGFGSITGLGGFVLGSPLAGGAAPANPVPSSSQNGFGAQFDLVWLCSITLISAGEGYASTPAVVISGSGGATATATLGAASSGNPTVPGLHDQRLVLAGPVGSPQQFNFSQPQAFFNFNVSNPTQPSDAIQGTLVSGQLNTIKAMISQPYGLIVLSDKQAWLINGGSNGAPVSATSIVANSQAYNGASDVPPIVANDNILYVQSKGSIVRDLVYNYYTQIYTGSDISVISSHLFYGFQITEWAWAEEPFKLVWAVRNDGQLLVLTFLKEQELIAWAHADTNGSFKSIATVTESVALGNVDAIYTAVQRTINGQTVQYIERMAELYYPTGVVNAWCVDAGIGYNGMAETTFSGAEHLGGQVVTGLADGVVINFTMPESGTFVFGAGGTAGLTNIPSASIVTIGLAYLPQLQTLQLDLGEPTVQGKRKKIAAVTVRCNQTLGLSIGATFGTLVPMQDLIEGNVGTMTNEIVTDLVTGDARTIIDPNWTVQGQYCIEQPFPMPASILGVIPEIEVGDTPK